MQKGRREVRVGIGAREGLGWTGTMALTILIFKFLPPKKGQDAPAKEKSTATNWESHRLYNHKTTTQTVTVMIVHIY